MTSTTTTASRQTLGCWPRSAPDRGPTRVTGLSLKGPEEAFFLAHVRAPGATRSTPQNGSRSPAEEHILAVRDHFVAALADYGSDERNRLANFLLDRCQIVHVTTTDIDQAHRMFTVLNARGKPLARNDILKADLLGRVPHEAAAAATRIWDEAEGRARRALRAAVQPYPGHVWAARRPGDRRHRQDCRGERAVRRRSSSVCCGRPRASSTTSATPGTQAIPNRPPSTQLLRYLGWHSFSDWIPPAMLWWLEKGEDAEGLARFLARLDRLAFGIRVLGIGGSKRARRFGMVAWAINNGDDLEGAGNPLEFTRQELRTIQHNLRDLHARNAPAAKHLLMRLTDQKAGRPQASSRRHDGRARAPQESRPQQPVARAGTPTPQSARPAPNRSATSCS